MKRRCDNIGIALAFNAILLWVCWPLLQQPVLANPPEPNSEPDDASSVQDDHIALEAHGIVGGETTRRVDQGNLLDKLQQLEHVINIEADAHRAQIGYGGYALKPTTDGGYHIKVFVEDKPYADIVIDTDFETWISYEVTTPSGTAQLGARRLNDSLVAIELDGSLIALAMSQDEDGLFGNVQYFGEIEPREAVRVLVDVMSDNNVQDLRQASAQMSFWDYQVCTTAECNNTWPPGQSPLMGIANCVCHCCVDLGGCIKCNSVWCDCFGPWYNLPFFTACMLMCVPVGPFASVDVAVVK